MEIFHSKVHNRGCIVFMSFADRSILLTDDPAMLRWCNHRKKQEILGDIHIRSMQHHLLHSSLWYLPHHTGKSVSLFLNPGNKPDSNVCFSQTMVSVPSLKLTVMLEATISGISSFVGLIITWKGTLAELRVPSDTRSMNWSAVGSVLWCLD